jgi:2-polyprenyl-3-methyl-5-hydroxy-6-metoxy-1,4-benzoquinol methylase
MARLLELSKSPYPPEPPRRSVVVEAIMKVAGRPQVTPHLHGGTDAEKVLYEYERTPGFWEVIGEHVPLESLDGKDILDAGCGWGGKAVYCAERLPNATVTGFDLEGVFDPAAPTSFARERGVENCVFLTGFAEDMPFEAERFDVVVLDDVLEHVQDPDKVLAESWRVLRRGGLVLASFPSIRMLNAHHLDHAISVPGLHYLLPIKRWAGGLNHLLLTSDPPLGFQPISEVVPRKYSPSLTRDLNGIDFRAFRGVAEAGGWKVRRLELTGYPRNKFTGKKRFAYRLYDAARSIHFLREPLSRRIVFVGEK